jgi:tungstate transport system substrate-binding protein
MRKTWGMLLLLFLFLSLIAVGCGGTRNGATDTGDKEELILVTTTSTYDSGLLDYLLPFFEEKYNYDVKVISLGTGQALEQGKSGDADVALVHAKPTELQMVAEGHFVDRVDVMYNDFVIVGPDADPVGLKDMNDLKEVFTALAEKESTFISRGDDSGTHKKERSLWEESEVTTDPAWYLSAGAGMGDTLRMADEMLGYTLTDRATYLSLRETLDVVIVFEGNSDLFNQYGIMAVNPANYQNINYVGATRLIEFFSSVEGQERIAEFKPFGDTLFFPNAE